MNVLDNQQALKKSDPSRALDSIVAFPQQLKDIWQQAQKIEVPKEFNQAQNIVVAGMGGSALGGRIFQSLFENKLSTPFQVITEYKLPAYVNQKTLVIIASYSGNTEEILSCFAETQKRQAMIFGITTGGKLGEKIKNGLTGFVFKPQYNYLGYPKTAIGYSLGGLLAFFDKAGLIKPQFKQALQEFKIIQKNFLATTPFKQNPAKKLAQFLYQKIGVLIASEHLKGATWTARNQINEIAHSFCLFFDLPEMDHHLVEAFGNPENAKTILGYVFMQTSNYHQRVKIRYPVTQQIIQKIGSSTYQYNLQANNKLAQAMEVIQLGGFASVYLSLLSNQDPGPEPWIIYLKKQLAAHEKKE